MKKIVFDVPAESGGALTVLNQYYTLAKSEELTDWIFVISTPNLLEQKNIKIIKYPWIKKSWFHRLFFDKIVAPRLVNKYQVDEVLSLQNIIIPRVKIPQVLYLHQSLPFSEKKYHLFENFKFWMYQNVISLLIYDSIRKSDKVIVQTQWMLDAIVEKIGIDESKIEIQQPIFNIKVKEKYTQKKRKDNLFFYPAGPFEYKNHILLLKACMELKKMKINNYKIVLSLKGDENNHLKNIYNKVKSEGLPIEFVGPMGIEEVYNYYCKSVLIFPSYIETFGLPLLEAKMHESPILASNCAFSKEILSDYRSVKFFDPFNEKELTELMISEIN